MNSSPELRPPPAVSVLSRFQTIDRRVIYVLVFGLLLMPLIFPFTLPQFLSPEVEKLYQSIDAAPKDKIVLVGVDWSSATQGENLPQTRAVLEHLFRDARKVVFISFVAQGPEFATRLSDELAKKYNRKYGTDYANLGFKVVTSETAAATFQSFARNFASIFKQDVKGTPIGQIPVTRNLRSIRDVGIIAEFTGAGWMDYYVQFLYGPYKVPLVQGCTAIIGPEQYPRLRAGQLSGLLVGMAGAAEYEGKLGIVGIGTQAMNSQSLGHFLIIAFIILGNIGAVSGRQVRPT